MDKPASNAQTFAIFCALKVDVRACALTYDKASGIIALANSPAKLQARAEVEALPGAVVKGPLVGRVTSAKVTKDAPETFDALWARAYQAGVEAGNAVRPHPMTVAEHESPLDDSSPIRKAYFVTEGACGFAWVTFPGTTAFARWAKKKGYARAAYGGGFQYWVHDHNQSIDRKEAHAAAFAKVLSEAGIERAYPGSRLD